MISLLPTRRRTLALLGGCLVWGNGPASALSPPALPANLRLIGGLPQADESFLVGAALSLQPGWMTYWRTPGEAGVPPIFDWSRSRNLAEATVLYPAPRRIAEADGTVLGYEQEVIFPITVRARDAGAPVTLVLDMQYGVCQQVCIPARSEVRLEIGRASPPAQDGALIDRYLALVPRPSASGTAVSDWTFDAAKGALSFTARLPGGVEHAVVEGPPEWGLSMPSLARTADGGVAASLLIRHLPPAAERSASLIVTVIGKTQSVEETRRLD